MISDDEVVEVSIYVGAPPDIVFPYFTDPVRYTEWMGSSATLEPTPGGMYRVSMRDGVEVVGEFLEVDPPRLVVFTWGWSLDPVVAPGSTRVVVTLNAEGSGTRVLLRHHNLPDDAQRAHHRGGWEMYLNRLGLRAGGTDPGPDPNIESGGNDRRRG